MILILVNLIVAFYHNFLGQIFSNYESSIQYKWLTSNNALMIFWSSDQVSSDITFFFFFSCYLAELVRVSSTKNKFPGYRMLVQVSPVISFILTLAINLFVNIAIKNNNKMKKSYQKLIIKILKLSKSNFKLSGFYVFLEVWKDIQ